MTRRATFARALSCGAALALAAWLLPSVPASAGDNGDDPEQAVQEFEAKTRKEVDDAVAELSKEVDDLRTQLKKAEAGLRRLQAMQRALDTRTDSQAARSSYVEPGASPAPGSVAVVRADAGPTPVPQGETSPTAIFDRLPAGQYMHDDVQYFPPGPQLPSAVTPAASRRSSTMGQPAATAPTAPDAQERRLREVERKLDLILKHMEAQKAEPGAR